MPKSKEVKIKGFRSLSVTLTTSFLILSLSILLLVAGSEVYFNYQAQQKLIISPQQLIAREVAGTVGSFIQEKSSVLSKTILFANLLNSSQSEQKLALDRLLGSESSFRRLVLLNSEKETLAESSRLSGAGFQGLAQMVTEELFLQTSHGKTYIGPVYVDEITQEPMVIMAAPVTDVFRDFKGILMTEVNLKFMWDLFSTISVGETGLAYVIDRQGYLVAFEDISRVLKGENIANLKEVSDFINNKELVANAEISEGILGTRVVSTFAPLDTPDWAVVVELPISEAYGSVIQMLLASLAVILLNIFLAIGVGNYFSKRITRPLINLRDAAKKLSQGKMNTRIEVESRNEIKELADDFNNMADKVQIRTYQLSEGLSRLESLVESVKLGVIMVDLSYNVLLVNSAAKLIFGKSPQESLTFRELEEKLKGVQLSQALTYYVQAGQPLNIKEAKLGDKDFRLFLSSVRDATSKQFIGAVMVIEDISEQKFIDRMRTEIVAVTSHQLRTPLSVVRGNLEMVLGGDFGKITKGREILEEALGGNDRMIKLVNDLMDVSKIEEGKFKLEPQDSRLEDIVAEIIKEIKPFIKEKNVSLSFVPLTGSLPVLKIDRQRVRHVINNLIINAVKYSSPGGNGKVSLSLEKDDNFITIVVKDNGIGIPKTEQGNIFEKFVRGSNVGQLDPGGGTGLGLYIAKAVVEQSGGKIWFVSEEGKGTTFYVALPYDKV